jgi:hypothetical protein
MAYSYFNQPTQNQTFNQFQNQQMFPQPSGNVYSINNSLEVANVPTGAGVSVALCMPENLMYIKTTQNGSPLFWSYKITPYTKENSEKPAPEVTNTLEDRILAIEDKLNLLIKELGGNTNESKSI